MFLVYNFLLIVGFLFFLPRFIFQKKYSESLRERLGNLPEFNSDGKKVIWLHCVSVGETQAARPLVKALVRELSHYKLVISTTTPTGQEIAKKLFSDDAALIFYFPFDFPFAVRRALNKINPEIVLLMETEIWFNFINEAHKKGVKVCIVNARLSEKSAKRYSLIKRTIKKVLQKVSLILAQSDADAERFVQLGATAEQIRVTGNLKFDQISDESESNLTKYFSERFRINSDNALILAASTHEPEETWLLEAFRLLLKSYNGALRLRLMIVPRHPERFELVAERIKADGWGFVRRSEQESEKDKLADVILLDSIGELRAAMPLATIVFVGGSLIPHGGQNILEAAVARKPIVTGLYTMNFESIIKEFLKHRAIIQLPKLEEGEIASNLAKVFSELLNNVNLREELAQNAFSLMESSRGASLKTLIILKQVYDLSAKVITRST